MINAAMPGMLFSRRNDAEGVVFIMYSLPIRVVNEMLIITNSHFVMLIGSA